MRLGRLANWCGTAYRLPHPKAPRGFRIGTALQILSVDAIRLIPPTPEGAVAHAMPPVKKLVGSLKQRLADLAAAVLPVDHRLEVAPQVRPTQLAAFDPGISGPAI